MSQPLTLDEINERVPNGSHLLLYPSEFFLFGGREPARRRRYRTYDPEFSDYYWDRINAAMTYRPTGSCCYCQAGGAGGDIYVDVEPPVLSAIIWIAADYLALRGRLKESGNVTAAVALGASCLKTRWAAELELAPPPLYRVV